MLVLVPGSGWYITTSSVIQRVYRFQYWKWCTLELVLGLGPRLNISSLFQSVFCHNLKSSTQTVLLVKLSFHHGGSMLRIWHSRLFCTLRNLDIPSCPTTLYIMSTSKSTVVEMEPLPATCLSNVSCVMKICHVFWNTGVSVHEWIWVLTEMIGLGILLPWMCPATTEWTMG